MNGMRRGWITLAVLLVPIAVGSAGAAILVDGGSGPASVVEVAVDTTVNGTTGVGIELDGTGPGCIGGLCPQDLPEAIEYERIGAYLAVLRDALAADPSAETATACHTMAHEIGRRVIESGSIPALLDLDDGRCLYGYQHGVLEGWSLSSDLEALIDGIPAACDAYSDGGTSGGIGAAEVDYARGSCAHGIGHAIALQNVGSVREAVALCSGAGTGQIGGCAGGVFMAYASENPSQGGSATTLKLERGEVEDLCTVLEGEFATECWSKLWLLGSRVGMDAKEVSTLCPASASSCGRGVGEGLYYETGMDAEAAMSLCPGNVRESCAYGVAWAEANAWVGAGGKRGEYRSVCGRFDGEQRTACTESEQAALAGAVE